MQVSGKKLALVLVSWLSFFSFCNSQQVNTTSNLITNSWSGVTSYSGTGAGYSGGNIPGYNPATNTIYFGYLQSTVSQSIAINSALNGTGIQVSGYEYSWQYLNQDDSVGSLTSQIRLTSNTGATLGIWNYTMPRTTSWTTISGVQNFGSQYSLSGLGTLGVSFTGKDSKFWAGYYGPQLRNVDVRLQYSSDTCSVDPLSNTNCPGYAQAYFNQQCTISALYSSLCPGYAQAYFTLQCSTNSLYNPQCPGYAQAYFNQQCVSNPLYNTGCSGYQQAYFNQQCTANPLYNVGCSGYADAFKAKQIADACTANPQSSPSCQGYVAPQAIVTTTTSTSSISTSVSTIILPGSDPVASITQPKVVDDPVVNQLIEKPQQKVETISPVSSQTSTQQMQATRPQQTRSQQTATARANAITQTRIATLEEKKEEDKIAALSTIPGFSAYENARLPDLPFYKVEEIYKRVTLPDNQRAQRLLNQRSDRIHREMVDEQYRR
jgi:hypothetical protein